MGQTPLTSTSQTPQKRHHVLVEAFTCVGYKLLTDSTTVYQLLFLCVQRASQTHFIELSIYCIHTDQYTGV